MYKNENQNGLLSKSRQKAKAGWVFSMVAISIVINISGCSNYRSATPANKSEIEQCISILNHRVSIINNIYFKDKKPDNSEYDKLYVSKRDELISALEAAKTSLKMVEEDGKIEKTDIGGWGDRYTCKSESIDSKYRSALYQLEHKNDVENLDEMNKQIDTALDEMMDKYKKDAVRHKVLGGPGPRVDMFEMKNGTVVYCKTTVTDAGKAVSCN